MKRLILLPLTCLFFPLLLNCNEPYQIIAVSPEDAIPSNFVENAFLVLEDCILENYSGEIEDVHALREKGFGAVSFSVDSSVRVYCAKPRLLCAKYSVIDSNGIYWIIIRDLTGCEGARTYDPDGSDLPAGYVTGDTLYLQDYVLENWPDERPEGDYCVYGRLGPDSVVTRYALPRLCGQYVLIDENGLPAGYFIAVGGCAGYREFVNR